MKKRICWIAVAILVLAILFVPIPGAQMRDGGTREYTALTYKVVSWHRLYPGGVYEETKVYWLGDRYRSTEDLWAEIEPTLTNQLVGQITEISGDLVLVRTVDNGDAISFSKKDLPEIDAQVGATVVISYRGGIMESYPAQIHAVDWQLPKDLRYMNFPGVWLTEPKPEEALLFEHLTITQIYADCFIATPVIPMPYEVKLNGKLSEDWCVGDQVSCTYENIRADGNRVEADLLTVEASDFELKEFVAYKPVIYLYPETAQKVTVTLEPKGRLTCTYPAYEGGWTVTAQPDGTLTDEKGQTYNYLYWEGQLDARWDLSRGFCVRGEDTAAFLEQALEKLGLTRREANEFIVYWLPQMEQNAWNVIAFQQAAYTDAAALDVQPRADTAIRVFMTWYPSESYVNLPAQELTAPDRKGFTLVEWGGVEIKAQP